LALTGLALPEAMRPVERRALDTVVNVNGQPPRVLEVDETQHFNRLRAQTLRRYKDSVSLAFDPDLDRRQ
jgi:hypothetical protein